MTHPSIQNPYLGTPQGCSVKGQAITPTEGGTVAGAQRRLRVAQDLFVGLRHGRERFSRSPFAKHA